MAANNDGLNGLGIGITSAGIVLILSAWRNWTIAETIRNVVNLARGVPLPPANAGEVAGIATLGGKLTSGQDGATRKTRKLGTVPKGADVRGYTPPRSQWRGDLSPWKG